MCKSKKKTKIKIKDKMKKKKGTTRYWVKRPIHVSLDKHVGLLLFSLLCLLAHIPVTEII